MLLKGLFTEKELRTIVSRELGTWSEFDVLDAVEEPLGRAGGGFMSEQLQMCVTAQLLPPPGKAPVPRVHQFFVKVVPTSGEFRKAFAVSSGTYDREQHFYADLDQVLRFNDVCGDEGRKLIPRHFLARSDALVMENLFLQGFRMIDARGYLDLDHVALVVDYLASFHAATLIHEEKRNERMDQNAKYILNDLMVAPFEEKNWFPAGFKTMSRFIDMMPRYKDDRTLKRRVRETLPAVYQRTAELVKPSKDIRNVVCHGDLWSNNILFHYDASGKPDDLRFIDFQWLRYAAPTTDLMMILHLSTDREFRRQHEADLLDLYHRSFSEALRRNGVPESVFPKEPFLRSCEEVRLMARTTAASYCSLVFMDAEYSSQFLYDDEDCQRFCHEQRYEEACHCFNTDAQYRERVTEIMEDFIENCVLTFL